jgi:hypothetical protein
MDKFALIGFQLAPTTADADLKAINDAKKARDALAHGEAVDESALPVKSVREAASRYVRLHLEQGSSDPP